MKRAMHLAAAAALAVALAAAAAAGQPQDDASEAKKHFLKGKSLEEMGEHAKAIEELEASYALSPQPVVLFNLGVIYDKLGDAAAALTCYDRYIDESEALPQDTADKLEKRIKKLRDQVAVLTLSVDQAGAEVIVDGKPAGLTPAPEIFLNLGTHELEIRKEGFETVRETVKALSFGKMELSFSLKVSPVKINALPADAPEAGSGGEAATSKADGSGKKTRRMLPKEPFAVFMGVGGALAVTAGIVGLISLADTYTVGGKEKEMAGETRKNLVLSAEILIGIGGGFLLTAIVLGPLTDFHKRSGTGFTVFPFVARGSAGAGLFLAF